MLELRDLQRFVTLAEERHFGRAALRLGMGQPQLSRALQRLERHVGTRLIARTSREVAPTEAGRTLLEDARRVIAIAEAAPGRALQAARGEAGTLTLGFSGSCAYAFLPAAIEGFRRTRPGIELRLREMSAAAQTEALQEGSCDLCLRRALRLPDGFAGAQVFEEPLLAALPRTHALAGRGRLGLRDFAGSPFVAFPRQGTDFQRQLVDLCQEAGFEPRIVQEVSPMHALIGLVGAGVGVAVVPASVRKLRFAGVAYRGLAGLKERSRVFAVWRPDRLSAPARAFAEHLGVSLA
ncbi:LysR substrate-binding domain-containing protein [Falsiroseomonas sp. HW251]|uniref:LysR substrate-binding domain-containing protein n=1 Tax=Falsiroseomonas sp. HW251 TaxID=3390998 RepID=UPI003D316EEE